MKKIAFALLSMLLVTPCMANIHVYSGTVETVVKQKFTGTDAQVAAVAEYNAQVKKANNAGIPASGIWSVCKAGGWDITKPDGESKCRDFGNTLLKYATWKFKEVCDKDNFMVKKGTGKCVDDVFSNKVLGGVKVNMLVAPGLAKEYARVKFGDKNLVCSKKHRSTTLPPDDYVQCLSMDKNMAYEFRFDSVTATMDNVITEGTESGICKIYDVKYSPLGVTLDTAYSKGESWPAACETTDAAKCSKINETMQKFGRTAKIGSTGSKGNKHSACIIKKDAISASSLRTAFGIDNYVFKKGGVQLNATTAVKDQVCAYVRQAVKSPTITSCVCNDGFTQLYDFSGMITETDDVLTCKVNNKPIDFVFDDLSEHNKKIATGGSQGMDCMAAGGTYAGQQCMYLDEKQCKLLAKANLKNCPNCKKVEYKNGVCQLPSGADAVQVQKNTRLALIVGGAVVGVVVTVASAGTAGAPVAAVVFTLVETGGAVIEYNAQAKIDGIADEFLLTSIKCKSASCAEKLVKENLQRMSNVAGDMQTAERNAVDKELARLVGLLPNDSQLFIDILGGESLTEANHKPLFDADSWEPEQVWRAVGITLQMTSIFGAVGKWVLKSTGILAKDLPEATIKITSKAKLAREGIIKAGKDVKTTDGKVIKILGVNKKIEKSTSLGVAQKQIDNLLDQIDAQEKNIMYLMDKYNIDVIPNDAAKLEKLLNEYPDLNQAVMDEYKLSQQIKQIRYDNPGLWVPGEDVANYYDVEALQKRLKDIADKDADYIAVLRKRQTELKDQIGSDWNRTNARSPEVNARIKQLEEEKRKILKTYSTEQSEISDKLFKAEKDLRSQNPDLEALYKNDYIEYSRIINQNPTIQQYRQQYNSIEDAKKLAQKENPEILKIDNEIHKLEVSYTPEATELINEQYLVDELLLDAEKTVGDKQNKVWWDAIPKEIKDKYVKYKDDQIVELLAKNDELSVYINNFDKVSKDPQQLEKFYATLEKQLNSVLPDDGKITTSLYSNPNSTTYGSMNKLGDFRVNIDKQKTLDRTIGTAKHEVLGHRIDQVAPNYGLQGETMQDAIPSFTANSTYDPRDAEILSHGNNDPGFMVARSPIGTEFPAYDITEEAAEALRKEGWTVYEATDPDTYFNGYRREMTEQAAHLLTPTSKVKKKVNNVRKELGLPSVKN